MNYQSLGVMDSHSRYCRLVFWGKNVVSTAYNQSQLGDRAMKRVTRGYKKRELSWVTFRARCNLSHKVSLINCELK
jgi:hypothetical protein